MSRALPMTEFGKIDVEAADSVIEFGCSLMDDMNLASEHPLALLHEQLNAFHQYCHVQQRHLAHPALGINILWSFIPVADNNRAEDVPTAPGLLGTQPAMNRPATRIEIEPVNVAWQRLDLIKPLLKAQPAVAQVIDGPP